MKAARPYMPVFHILLVLLLGCDTNEPPVIQDFGGTKIAYVGIEFVQEIVFFDPDADSFSFSWKSDIEGLEDRELRPTIEYAGSGRAFFRWTPLAQDVGTHTFEITVSDGHHKTSAPLTIEVRASLGASTAPVFVKPVGSGAVLDLSKADCIDVEIEVEDPDSPQVDIYMEDPIEEGYELEHDPGALEALFTWCPTPRQVDAGDRYVLNLAADDRDGHITRKRFVIILRRDLGEDCPGEAPSISVQQVPDQETLDPIRVEFTVTDDVGLPAPPVLYYTTEPVTGEVDVSQMIPLTASMDSGTYYVEIPNPVADASPGESATVSFVVEAEDMDNDGQCVHRTRAPASGVYSFTVTHPTEIAGGAPVCSPCVVDAQCGGPNDLCVYLRDGNRYCLKDCEDDPDSCPEGTTCSVEPFSGSEGTARRQCVPAGAICRDECEDDAFEENDTLSSQDPEVPDGTTTGLMMCPSQQDEYGDPDWFRLPIDQTTLVYVEILFSQADGDLDLLLTDDQGNEIASSLSVTDNEAILECLDPGDYYVLVASLQNNVHAPYTMYVEKEVGGCCNDDELEPNDSTSQATVVHSGDTFENLSICQNDVDWFAIDIPEGKELEVLMLFDQNTANQDLDVYLYDTDGTTNLTPCCDPTNGQSSTSDEELHYTVDHGGTYYVKVEGYMNSTNTYMIYFEVRDATGSQ